ncbi:hypothetical protein DPV78_006226 [Talaromyces pinophilus]|nr:hypothetical protein DPV78_006226 [Talaromyces pinophilus]
MTNAEDGAGNIFDELLAGMDEEWGSQDPFMLQNEVPPEQYIDPALFAASLGMPDIYSALPSDSAPPTRQEEHPYPSAVTSSPTRQAEQVTVSTPIQQHANTPASVSDYSPSSTGLHTPTRRDRGHYGSARRRTGALSNFQPIASSPQRESAQDDTGYSFEPIPEHQQGILSPSNYINEDIPEFRPRRVVASPSCNYQSRFDFPEELNSPCLVADPDAFEGGVGNPVSHSSLRDHSYLRGTSTDNCCYHFSLPVNPLLIIRQMATGALL